MGLASYLDGAAAGGEPGFEQLVGAFESLRRSVALLGKLKDAGSQLANGVEADDLNSVEDFCDRVYRKGTATALQLMDEAAGTTRKANAAKSLVERLNQDFGGHITYATLNYDTLLMQALIDTGMGFADLSSWTLVHNFKAGRAYALRTDARELEDGRSTRLLSLHGSLLYWQMRKEDTSRLVKIQATPPQRKRLLNQFAEGKLKRLERPLVIFGNQRDKSVLVKEHPFNVAYERLTADLNNATGVLVIGYGFGDEVLNSAIRDEVRWSEKLPAVLVVTSGPQLANAFVGEVFENDHCLHPVIFRKGIANVLGSAEWRAFVDAANANY